MEELDGDLWGYFLDRLVNFVGGIGQAVRVDVDANAATRTLCVHPILIARCFVQVHGRSSDIEI